jgi:serine/threonine-protein kinase HipA
VHDEQGVGWIAKFPSVKDVEGAPQRGAKRWDIVGLEATGMALARGAGLDVADTRIETAGSKRVLLVRRFDISAEGGRNHMVSFKTLCGERNGVYVTSYSELFAQVLDASCRPKADVEMLYRHMVVNAAIGNTDDHLKNFWMLRDEDGWKLSPAIDLVPAGLNRREHQLSFLHHYDCPSGRDLIAIARQWRIKPSKAREIVEEVADAAGLFESTARTHGVDEDNIPLIWNDVRRRREVLLKDLPA